MKNRFFLFRFLTVIMLLAGSCKDEDSGECGTDATSEFPGTWDITETCGSQDFNYAMTITTGTESDLLFQNIGQGGPNAIVKVDVCGNDFTILSQTVQSIDFSGEGSISSAGNQITFTWNGQKGNCSSTGTKQ